MLMNFVIRTIINGIALWIAAFLIDGIEFGQGASTGETVTTVLLVALVSLPFIILTLGLFVFIVNALMLWLTSWLSEKLGLAFHVQEFFWDAVLGSLVITFVSMILGFFNPKD